MLTKTGNLRQHETHRRRHKGPLLRRDPISISKQYCPLDSVRYDVLYLNLTLDKNGFLIYFLLMSRSRSQSFIRVDNLILTEGIFSSPPGCPVHVLS